MLVAIRRRKAPILALRREIVRRRADAAAERIKRTVRPQITAVAIGGEREIVINPDLHAFRPCVRLRLAALQAQMPLEELKKTDPLAVHRREGRHGF